VIPQDIRTLSHQRALEFRRILSVSQPNQVGPGQIWSTHSVLELPDGRCFETHQPRLVVVLDGAGNPSEPLEQIATAPLSLSTPMAAEFDLIIPQDESPLGFGFMVEVWNETPVLKAHLRRFLGKLPDEAVEVLQGLYEIQLLGQDAPSTFPEWVGLRIMGEEDPRLGFQESEVEQVAYLARAATAALAVAEKPAEIRTFSMGRRRVFELPLVARRAFGFGEGAALAVAAGAPETQTIHIVSQSEGDECFRLELLPSRRRPYRVYFVVRELAPKLEGSQCAISFHLADQEWRSAPARLSIGTEIEMGQDRDFSPSLVKMVKVEILEKDASSE